MEESDGLQVYKSNWKAWTWHCISILKWDHQLSFDSSPYIVAWK